MDYTALIEQWLPAAYRAARWVCSRFSLGRQGRDDVYEESRSVLGVEVWKGTITADTDPSLVSKIVYRRLMDLWKHWTPPGLRRHGRTKQWAWYEGPVTDGAVCDPDPVPTHEELKSLVRRWYSLSEFQAEVLVATAEGYDESEILKRLGRTGSTASAVSAARSKIRPHRAEIETKLGLRGGL